MEKPRITTLEVISNQKLQDECSVIAVFEVEHVVKHVGYRFPNESCAKLLLSMLRARKEDLLIDPLMSDVGHYCFSGTVEKTLIELKAWGSVDVKFKYGRCLAVVYNNGYLSKSGEDHLREVLKYFAREQLYSSLIDWEWWGGKRRFFADLKTQLESKPIP